MVEITRQPAPPYGTKIILSGFSRRTSRQLRERHRDQLEHYVAQPPGAERGLRLERSLGLIQGLFFHSLEVEGYMPKCEGLIIDVYVFYRCAGPDIDV